MEPVPDFQQETAQAARSISLAKWLAMSWALMLILGIATLRSPGALAAQNTVSWDRAAFTATNASTLTGFSQVFAAPGDFAPVVQIVFVLQVLSGLTMILIGGGALMARLVGSKHTDSPIALAGLLLIAFSGILGAATVGPGESLGVAVARGIGALAGAGTLLSPTRPPTDLMLHIVLLPLGIVGGLGLVVLLDLWNWIIRRQRVSTHSARVMTLFGGTYIVAALLVALLLLLPGAGDGQGGRIHQPELVRASALVLGAQAFGATTEVISLLPRGIDWILIGVAAIGLGTLGTAGGMGLGWLATLRSTEIRRGAAWAAIQGAIMLVMLVTLLRSDVSLAADRAVMLVVNSSANVGLSHGAISLTGLSPVFLTVLMIVGRLLPLWAVSRMISARYPTVGHP